MNDKAVAVVGAGGGLGVGQALLMSGDVVTVNEITYGTWATTRNEADDFSNDVALIRACTGLAVDHINEMDAPDYNELRRLAVRLNNPQREIKAGETTIKLKSPVTTIMGIKSDTVLITMPKVKVSRELAKLVEHGERMNYMIKAVTGIADLDALHMSDYSLLVLHVPDFFTQGAAYFLAVK